MEKLRPRAKGGVYFLMNDENERVESIIDVVLEMIDDGFGLDEIADYLRESLADLPDYQ